MLVRKQSIGVDRVLLVEWHFIQPLNIRVFESRNALAQTKSLVSELSEYLRSRMGNYRSLRLHDEGEENNMGTRYAESRL